MNNAGINKSYAEDSNWTNNSFGCYKKRPENCLDKSEQHHILIDVHMMSKLRNLRLKSFETEGSIVCENTEKSKKNDMESSILEFDKIKNSLEAQCILNCLNRFNGMTGLEKLCDFIEESDSDTQEDNSEIYKKFKVSENQQKCDEEYNSQNFDQNNAMTQNDDGIINSECDLNSQNDIEKLKKLKDDILGDIDD